MGRRFVKSVPQQKFHSTINLKPIPIWEPDPPDRPDWFDIDISNLINVPILGAHQNYASSQNNIGLGCLDFNNRYVMHNTFNVKSDCKFVNTSVVNTVADDIVKLTTKFNKACTTSQTKLKHQPAKLKTSIKTLTTKHNKTIDNLNKVTICNKFPIYPNQKQQTTIHKWFDEARKVYDYCIQKYNEDNTYFDEGYMAVKVALFKELYGEDGKPAPYDILTDEVRIFCSNLKSCRTNLENGNIDSFTMKPKSNRNGQCLFIPKTAIGKKTFYVSHLRHMIGMEHIISKKEAEKAAAKAAAEAEDEAEDEDEDSENDEDNEDNEEKNHEKIVVTNDCRLIYNKLHKSYTLLVPVNKDKTIVENREKIVALDPGGKIFMAYYSPNDFGFLGYEFRKLFLDELAKVGKLQRILAKGVNKKGHKINNKNTLKRRIDLRYERMRNLRDELHHKVALFLCRNYDTILIPEFKTKQMLKTDPGYGAAKKRVNVAYEHEGVEAGKEALRQYKKKKRLNKKDKFVLNMLSHYRFRQYLIHKANEYDCKVEIVTEEYTSQACTKCGHKSVNYNYRQKKCDHCGYQIDRDTGGSRNILIKNVSKYINPDYIERTLEKGDCSCDDSTSDDGYILEEKGWEDDEYVKDMFEYRISNNDCDNECIREMREYIESKRIEGELDNDYNFKFIMEFMNELPNRKRVKEKEVVEDEREYKIISNKVDGPLDERTLTRGGTSYRR